MLNVWIEQNWDNINEWLRPIVPDSKRHLYDDLVQEVILAFIQHPKAHELVQRNEARWFIVRIALNQWKSTSSPFYKSYRLENRTLEGIDLTETDSYMFEDDRIIEIAIGILDEMYISNDIDEYYMAMVIMIYLSLDSNFSEMERRLDIPRTSLSKVYKKGIKVLKQRLKDKIKQIENGSITFTQDSDSIIERWNVLSGVAQRKAVQVHAQAVKNGILRNL